jgi:hypothetical protein
MASYTGTITVKIKARLLGHTPIGDGFLDITKRVAFMDGSSSSFTFTESTDGSLSSLDFSIFTMFPNSTLDWSAYPGADVDAKAQAALDDHTYALDIPSRTEVEVYEAGVLIFGGVVTQVSRESTGGGRGTGSAIITKVKCSDYTALLDEVVITQYKAPYDTLDHELIRGGYATDKEKNGLKITKISDGNNGSGKRRITVALNDSHDLIVGQQVIIDRTTNYNSTWTVYSVDSVVSYTADNTALTYTNVADESSGRSTPYTASLFTDIRTTDPYSNASYSLGINYTTYVEENTNEKRFSPITYLPDAGYPLQLGAKSWIPLSNPKTESGRSSFDPRAMDARKDLRVARVDSEIVERYIVRSVGAYNSTSDYIDFTTIGDHSLSDGQVVSLGNIEYNNPGTYSSGFRVATTGATNVRAYTPVDPGFAIRSSGAITGVSTDGTYATYTAANTFFAGDPVGIYGITQSGSSGTLNIAYSIIEEATPTTFKIKNSSTNTWTSGGYAYVSYVEVAQTQFVQAHAQKYKIIAGKRVNGVTTLWHNGPAGWFDINDVIHVSGSGSYNGKFVVTQVGDGAASASNPFHVYSAYRKSNLVEIGVGAQTTPWSLAYNSRTKKATHPFKVGDIVNVSISGPYSGLGGTGLTITELRGGIYPVYAKNGTNTNLNNWSPLTKAQRGASTMALSSAGYSYVQFADSRTDDSDGPQTIGQSAIITTFNYAWPASAGAGRAAATPSATFVTMPDDTLTYIGGRQAVSFTASKYQGLSSSRLADVTALSMNGTSGILTLTTSHAHGFAIGESVVLKLTSVGTYNDTARTITAATALTFSLDFTGAGLPTASGAATGTAVGHGIGFRSMAKSTTIACLIRPATLSGDFKTIWHHGSLSGSSPGRKELKLNASGNIVYFDTQTTNSSAGINSGISVAAGETAIIYFSYDHATGDLTFQKNDETVVKQLAAVTPADTGHENFTIGYGYGSSTPRHFFDGLIGDIFIFDRALGDTEREQLVAWMAHWYTRGDLLNEDNDYRYLANLPGKSAASKLKEPFNGMTLRQALDYLAKKTGCQYWVDAEKNLHYKLREVKNYVSNSVFEDSFGNAGTTGWTLNSFTLTSRTGGPYGYGYSLTATGATVKRAQSKKFDVSASEILWASATIKSTNAAHPRLKIRFYDAGGTQVGSDVTIGGALSSANVWEKMWGMCTVPSTAGITQAALIFEHAAQSYTDFWANPFVTKITGEFGFADYGVAPGSTAEYMFDTALTSVIPLKPFESPGNISQAGSVTNRVHVYAKAITKDASGDLLTADVVTGQVIRYTFDYVQGVWQTHGKIIESSTVNTAVETQEDAVLAAATQFSSSGKKLQSFEFSHPTHASDGRLTTGSVIPYLWSQAGIAEPIVVKSQQTEILGGEIYYQVTLGSEPAFTKDAIILVQRDEITQSLGPGQLQFTKPSPINNLVANTIDVDGKPTTADLSIVLRWVFDRNDPRNKLFTNFEVQRRREELQQSVKSRAYLRKTGTAVSRTAAAVGGISTVSVVFAGNLAISENTFITVTGWKITGEKNGSLNGTWEIQSVSKASNLTTVTFQIYAGSSLPITAISKTKANAPTNLVFSWYEVVKTAKTGWGDLLTSDNQAVVNNTYTDSSASYKYRYQYRVRAITKDAAGGIRRGDYTYLPNNYANTTDNSAWLYVTRDLNVSGSPAISAEDTP